MFFGDAWTSDGADNDGNTGVGVRSTQPDDPDPQTTLLGYACCL